MNPYDKIRAALKSAGLTVYLPGAYSAPCKEPYVVVQNVGTFPFAGMRQNGYTLIDVHCYVPLNQYTQLQQLVENVKSALAPLSDCRASGAEGNHTIDATYSAHTTYVEYQILRTL